MKKILFYTDTPQIGGAELQIYLLAKFLNKEKFKPILVCSNFKQLDNWCIKFEKEGIEVIRLNVKTKHDIKHLSELKKIIKEKEIDLLHIHVWNPASCRYAFLAGSKTKTPIITTEHDPFKLSLIKNLFKKYTLSKISKIITISENNKKLLEELYPEHKDKLVMIHNGIDTTWWKSQLIRFTEKDRKKIKEETFFAKENTLIISCIAELHERKGQKYLINAIPEIVKEYPNLKFVFIGEGKERENLEKLVKKLKIEKHVTFTGKQKDIPQLLKASDIFALPSRREAFGLVNLEAMLIPLPIIASKVGGIPEIVKDGQTGILVEAENSEEFTKALKKLISSPESRNKMAIAGHKRILENFDAKIMAKNYEKAYQEI